MELELCYFKRGRGIYNMKTNQLKERIVNKFKSSKYNCENTYIENIKGVIDFIICVFWYWWIKQLIMSIIFIAFEEFSGSHMQHRECNIRFLIYPTCVLVTDPIIRIVGIKLRHLCAIICWERWGAGVKKGNTWFRHRNFHTKRQFLEAIATYIYLYI